MTKSLIKNTFREIKNTKARFISIMAIIALGVGFFAGIKGNSSVNVQSCKNLHGRAGAYGLPTCVNGRI